MKPGMRLRLTHNVDKERGFVNGNSGVVSSVLRHDVFLLQPKHQPPILVHPITYKGRKFLPVSYGYATTMRRAQGATLDQVGVWFDRRLPDRGYAYVGLSRAKRQVDVYHMGKIRRTDWRAVGSHDNEQSELSVLSESSSDEQDQSSFETTSDEPASSNFESTTLSSDME